MYKFKFFESIYALVHVIKRAVVTINLLMSDALFDVAGTREQSKVASSTRAVCHRNVMDVAVNKYVK